MKRRAFLHLAVWSTGIAGLPVSIHALAMPGRLSSFIRLSEFLLGIPLPGIAKLNTDLATVLFKELETYLVSPEAFTCKNEIEWGTGGASIPAESSPTPLSLQTLKDLLDTWDSISATAGDNIKVQVDDRIFGNLALSTLAQKVIALWYNGQINTIPGTANSFSRSLVWATAYTHPEAIPRSFGYWQYNPLATAEQEGGA